jgi:hypothetical protein
MGSKELTVEQSELALARRAACAAIPAQLVSAQKSSHSAMALACQAAGLEDKEIYLSLGIDAGHWTRIKKGEAHFPLDLIGQFCSIVGNTALPEWIAYQVGCGLVLLRTEAERRAEEAERQLSAEREKVKLLTEVLAGRTA